MTQKRFMVLIGIGLSMILLFIVYYMTAHYAYYTAGEIKKYNTVYVETTYNEKENMIISTENSGLYGPFYAEYQIGAVDEAKTTTVYNTFKMSGLKPLTTYNVTLEFNFQSLSNAAVDVLNVGTINYQPEEIYDPKTKEAYNNITESSATSTTETTTQEVESAADITEVTSEEAKDSTENTFTTFQVVEGMNTYSVDTTFQTNEAGEIWFVIAFDSSDNSDVDYRLSNILINYSEVE